VWRQTFTVEDYKRQVAAVGNGNLQAVGTLHSNPKEMMSHCLQLADDDCNACLPLNQQGRTAHSHQKQCTFIAATAHIIGKNNRTALHS
jgi:hypothetical protein